MAETTINAIDVLTRNQFRSDCELVLQQNEHVLAGTYDSETQESEIDYCENQLNKITMAKSATGSSTSELKYNETTFNRRQIQLVFMDWATLIGKESKLKTGIDLQSPIVRGMLAAYARYKDGLLIEGLFGTSYANKAGVGVTGIALPSTQKIAVDYEASGSNTNLTYAKMVAAVSLLEQKDVMMGLQKYGLMSPKQKEYLISKVTEFKSKDYANTMVAETYKLPQMLGVDWRVVTDGLMNKTSSTVYNCGVWVKPCVQMNFGGAGYTQSVRMDEIPGRGYPLQLYIDLWAGATRKQEEGVVQIAVDTSK